MKPKHTLITALFALTGAAAFAQPGPPIRPDMDRDHERAERAEHAERVGEAERAEHRDRERAEHHVLKEERRDLRRDREAVERRAHEMREHEAREHEEHEHMEH